MPTPFDADLAWSLLAALLTGALVGIEREKSKAASGNVGIGGLRTFTLFALVGALGGLLAKEIGGAPVLIAVVLGVAALVIAFVCDAMRKIVSVVIRTRASLSRQPTARSYTGLPSRSTSATTPATRFSSTYCWSV